MGGNSFLEIGGPAEMPAFLLPLVVYSFIMENSAWRRNVISAITVRAPERHIQHILNINMAMHE
jgi:hypothetical protein